MRNLQMQKYLGGLRFSLILVAILWTVSDR